MCEYCENDKTMLSFDSISPANWGWGYDDSVKLTLNEAEKDPDTKALFVDRGHLRVATIGDCDCLESGEKIKVNFCPMCGADLGA